MFLIVDLFLVIILISLAFVGFNVGIMKVLTVILGMYLGLQVAGLFYPAFGDLTADRGNTSSIYTNQIAWFFILWLVWSIIFSLVVYSFSKTIVLPKRIGNFNQLGGLVLGLFAALFAMFIVSFVLKNILVLIWAGAGGPDNWLGSLKKGFDESSVFNVLKSIKVVYLNTLSPWLPSGGIPVFLDTADIIQKTR